MTHTILLYGATGYSGGLIVDEAARLWKGGSPLRLVLAGRDGHRLAKLAERRGMDFRAFALDDRDAVARGVDGVDVILNAAGPFARTAEILATAALSESCHYVDISGEFDVYKRLDDLRRFASLRKVALVCGAAYCAAASDLVLDEALASLPNQREFGAIRIALSRPAQISRGSAETALRLTREQVAVLRDFGSGNDRSLGLWHVPAGMLERSFALGHEGATGRSLERIAAAASLPDTLVAARTIDRYGKRVRSVEGYLETSAIGRVGITLGGLSAPLLALPVVRDIARMQLDLLPDGPNAIERQSDPARLVLTIEDAAGAPLLERRLTTPNAYDFTARIALAVVSALVDSGLSGWCTPSQVLPAEMRFLRFPGGALRDCRIEKVVE